MASSSAAEISGSVSATRLEPDAIGVTQDTVIGMASTSQGLAASAEG